MFVFNHFTLDGFRCACQLIIKRICVCMYVPWENTLLSGFQFFSVHVVWCNVELHCCLFSNVLLSVLCSVLFCVLYGSRGVK